MSRNHSKTMEEKSAILDFCFEKEDEFLKKLRHYVGLMKESQNQSTFVVYDQIVKRILECLKNVKQGVFADPQHFPGWKMNLITNEFALSMLEKICKAIEEVAAGLYNDSMMEAEDYLREVDVQSKTEVTLRGEMQWCCPKCGSLFPLPGVGQCPWCTIALAPPFDVGDTLVHIPTGRPVKVVEVKPGSFSVETLDDIWIDPKTGEEKGGCRWVQTWPAQEFKKAEGGK